MGESRDVEDLDWRLQVATTVASVPPGSSCRWEPGDVIKAVIPVKGDRAGSVLSLPGAAALCMDMSYRLQEQATALRKDDGRWVDETGRYVNDKEAFDYMENMMGAVVFAFTALECFANEEIPDSFTYVRRKKKKGLFHAFDKPTIERNLSLDEKIGEVLPSALRVKSPKGTEVWTDFLALKNMRDRIVHMKTSDFRALADGPESIWATLVQNDQPSYATIAKRVIAFFYETKEKPPRWYRKIPF